MQANPNIIKMFSEKTQCWMCRHKFGKPVILPVSNPERGKFQPNINSKVLFHLKDTHGLPPQIVSSWIKGAIYEQELTLTGARNFEVDL